MQRGAVETERCISSAHLRGLVQSRRSLLPRMTATPLISCLATEGNVHRVEAARAAIDVCNERPTRHAVAVIDCAWKQEERRRGRMVDSSCVRRGNKESSSATIKTSLREHHPRAEHSLQSRPDVPHALVRLL